MLLNCSSPIDVAELAATLDEQQLVDGRQDEVRRDFGDRLPQLRARRRYVAELGAVAQLGHLPLLELGLGDDLAVDLHEHLLEDLRAERRHEQQAPGSARPPALRAIYASSSTFFRIYPRGHRDNPFGISILPVSNGPPSGRAAQTSARSRPSTRANIPPSARRIGLGTAQHLLFREPGGHLPGRRPGRPPAGRRGRPGRRPPAGPVPGRGALRRGFPARLAPEPVGASRFSFSDTGGTRVAPGHSPTTFTSRPGSIRRIRPEPYDDGVPFPVDGLHAEAVGGDPDAAVARPGSAPTAAGRRSGRGSRPRRGPARRRCGPTATLR